MTSYTSLHGEVEELKDKVARLEGCKPFENSQSIVSQVLQENFEHERCLPNLIIYGVPESSSPDTSVRIEHDKLTISESLGSLKNAVPEKFKLIRLGRSRAEFIRPVKMICASIDSAFNLFPAYNSAKRFGKPFPEGFWMFKNGCPCSVSSCTHATRTLKGESKVKNNIANHFDSILDLVFSSNKLLCVKKSYEPVVPADLYHPALNIYLPINLYSPHFNRSHSFYNFRKANFEDARLFLSSFDWETTSTNEQEAANLFSKNFSSVFSDNQLNLQTSSLGIKSFDLPNNVNFTVENVYKHLSNLHVNHNALIQVLDVSGIGEPLLSWFSSYLSCRYQWVKLLEVKSNVYFATFGVPQGSHLSSFQFSLFINSVSSVLSNSQILCFEDDIKLYSRISSSDDCILLQSDFDRFTEWFNFLGLSLNVSKCKTMTFARLQFPVTFAYHLGSTAIS
ncbi:hypothetical protein QTP88_004700 [Uroleucon formosanum]